MVHEGINLVNYDGWACLVADLKKKGKMLRASYQQTHCAHMCFSTHDRNKLCELALIQHVLGLYQTLF